MKLWELGHFRLASMQIRRRWRRQIRRGSRKRLT